LPPILAPTPDQEEQEMKMRWIALVALVALAALGAGCGSDDTDGDQGGSQSEAAVTDDSDATKGKSDDAMKDDSGDAMKEDSDEAMKEDSDEAMKDDGAMKDDSDEAMKSDDAAMKDDSHDAMKETAAQSSAKRKGRFVKVVGSEYGPVVADGKGEALYLFDKERSKKSRCYGACARAWPPVLTKGRPRAGKGAKAKLLGTTKRRNGKRQVTYRGHPLYYYVDDSPGTILCQNVDEFGGLWLVVKPNGRPVR
jgi:predicted lipoprotein with Yx(FWY)xxD motif